MASLVTHKINCPNENVSFRSIRELYPQLPPATLWDLFKECSGDFKTMERSLHDVFIPDSQYPLYAAELNCNCQEYQGACSMSMATSIAATPSNDNEMIEVDLGFQLIKQLVQQFPLIFHI